MKKLRQDEEWAMSFLRPQLSQFLPNGFEEFPQGNDDPPDCIVRDVSGKERDIRIEFGAIGPMKVFQIYQAYLKEEKHRFLRVRVPYEPELWLKERLVKKGYQDKSDFDWLCVHFSCEFKIFGMKRSACHTDQSFVPCAPTQDVLYRLQRQAWEMKSPGKSLIFVHPECHPMPLLSGVEPPIPPALDISRGYPTVQLWFASIPVNERISLESMPIESIDIKPMNEGWIEPEPWRVDYGKWGHTISLEPKGSGETIPARMLEHGPASMPDCAAKY